ncbi:MAG TPA: DEAD/DEAH box helicase [Thermogutta sp.]|nr:DEAD/DEAH box helicase [Thermogutta sp.]
MSHQALDRVPEGRPSASRVETPLPTATAIEIAKSWFPGDDFACDAHSESLVFSVQIYPTGWNRAIQRGCESVVQSVDITCKPPRVLSLQIRDPVICVRSFFFLADEQTEGSPSQQRCQNVSGSNAAQSRQQESQNDPQTPGRSRLRCCAEELLRLVTAGHQHRIEVPEDVIKLEDRLRYLLQPSLEAILAERQLEFPFTPFPYQLEGVAFLFPRHAAILADEMGLGKTMQAITAIRLLLRCGEVRRVLLVCPKPLVSNWRREFELWAPEIPVMVIEGDPQRRKWQWELADVPVRIANYELLPRDQEFFTASDETGQTKVAFDLVVLDESQRIKNRHSATNQAVCSIARKRSWALTGTPVENSTDDLVGIFEFLSPGFLSPDMKPQRLGRTIADYVLRRTKDRVLSDLPPKILRDAEVELTPEQRETYDLAETAGVLRLTELGDAVTIQHVFELVIRLKQICNFDPATGASAKMERLEADLEEIAGSGRKAIIFSQWVATLEEIGRRLERYKPLYFHGQTPVRQRDEVIRRFREDPQHRILLMSYGAGSVGLNLQFVNYVFLFDRWWNPAVEDQAINRAHRIGAAGPVIVTRFLTVDTIEQRINMVLEQKRQLFETIFSGTVEPKKLALTQEEIFGLFDLKTMATRAKAA